MPQEYMLKHHLVYTPLPSPPAEIEAEVSVKLQLLAGHHLGSGNVVVEFHLHGHPLDQTLDPWSFSAVGPHPHWQEDDGQVVLTVRRPQLAVLQVNSCECAGSCNSTGFTCVQLILHTPQKKHLADDVFSHCLAG